MKLLTIAYNSFSEVYLISENPRGDLTDPIYRIYKDNAKEQVRDFLTSRRLTKRRMGLLIREGTKRDEVKDLVDLITSINPKVAVERKNKRRQRKEL